MGQKSSKEYRSRHVERSMGSLAVAIVVLILIVRFWPISTYEQENVSFAAGDQEEFAMEEIQQTSQAAPLRPPPPPLPPVAVEDPPDLEFDEALDFDITLPTITGPPAEGRDESGDGPPGARATAQSARPVRFVEPEYTRDARRQNIKAQIVVEVTVDEQGRVAASRVIERYLLGDDSQASPVSRIGFGLEEAAIYAAERFLFRPAQFEGEAVRSQYQLRFSFGV
jgi:periplasmic protein TonB